MFGRTEDIIEMQEGNLVDDMDQACSIENMDDDNMPYTTLISRSPRVTNNLTILNKLTPRTML